MMQLEHVQDIPDKLYFRIGEVAKLIGVEPYVLRYWETEFSDIAPTKSRSRQRLYRKQDVELIYQIKELLYKQNYTIKGAKQKMKDLRSGRVSLKEPTPQKKQPTQLDFVAEVSGLSKDVANEIKSVIDDMDDYLKNL